MKLFQINIATCVLVLFIAIACRGAASKNSSHTSSKESITLSGENLRRAMALTDSAIVAHFTGKEMAMARFYNPYTGVRSEEKGSIWMYTSAIEAINAILHGLEAQKSEGDVSLYNANFERYVQLLHSLYENADYYLGTFELTSYTQTRKWSVYGVNRHNVKGAAKVAGIENVYDDQMWLVRELIEAYRLTKNEVYLQKAEYLTEYILDGWDCTRDGHGNEIGGITWGPGYVTKHACSNAPMVSPLVWLSELYKNKPDKINYNFIDAKDNKTRQSTLVKKSDYYLEFAKKIYHWQKEHLLREDGVYDDMMGGCVPGTPETEIVNGTVFRKGIVCRDRVGPAITYNSGTMLSGATDLYRVTNNEHYLDDARKLADASFIYFAKPEQTIPGYYTYDIRGFRNWFNGVLMRAYVDISPAYDNVEKYIDSFQKNLDYGYENFLFKGVLPTNLLAGWNSEHDKNNTEAMFSFAFAAEYAVLSSYELQK